MDGFEGRSELFHRIITTASAEWSSTSGRDPLLRIGPGAPPAVQGLLEATLRGLLQILKAEEGSISWLDAPRQELVVTIAVGPRAGSYIGYRQRVGQGAAGQAAASRQPLMVRDISSERIVSERGTYRTRSFLCIPLQTPHELYGVVNLTDKVTGEAFTLEDLDVAVQVVGQLAVALESLRHTNALQRQIELSEKFAAIGRLAAGLVHELSNPLDGANRYCSLMLEKMPEGHLREYLLQVKEGLNRIMFTVRTLGQLARQPMDLRCVLDGNQSIEEALRALGVPFGYPHVTVVRELVEGLPLIPDYGFVQVISNLIKNACDAMPQGGALTIKTERSGNAIGLQVSDTGAGIPPEQRAVIFDPFFTTKPQGQGMGLGLAIAQEIVNRYQGTISVQSEGGRGTTFIVHIPLSS